MRSFFSKEKNGELHATTKIVVASGCSGSGVSLVSELIASGLSKLSSVSLVELGKPYFYNALDFEKRFLNRGFIDFFEKIRNSERIKPGDRNSFEGINWIVKMPEDRNSLQVQELFRAMYFPKEEYSIFDCSDLDNQSALSLLAEADVAIVVIDPLPSKLIETRAFLEKIKINMPEAYFIINKMNNGVHRAELSRFLGKNESFSISSSILDIIYKAEYNAMPISSLHEAKDLVLKTQDMLHKLFQ